jgi:VWFA-related protein
MVKCRLPVLLLAVAAAIAIAGSTPRAAQPPAGGQPPAASQGQASPQGQAAPAQPPVFRGGVKLVRVDVSVTGRGDKPLSDLKPDEFELQEDGVTQRVETVQFVRLDGQPGVDNQNSLDIRSQDHAEAEAARDDVRVFVLFLDDYHIDRQPAITIPLRQMLTGFVSKLQPTDLVAIVDPLTPLSAIRFTRSKDQLTEIIRKFEGRQGEIFPIKSAAEENQLRSGEIDRLRAQVTFSALEALSIRLGGLKEGRKTIVFVSQGPRVLFSGGSIDTDLRDAIYAANRGNVTIHVVDPRGLAGAGFGFIDTLYRLANDTGGRAILHTNAFDDMLAKVVEDASAYYLLGYAPSRQEVDDGKFHKISVHVKRSGAHVQARQGYWAPSRKEIEAATAAANRPDVPGVSPAIRTLKRQEPHTVVQSWVGLTRNAQGQAVASITWEPMPTSQDRHVNSVDVEVAAADGKSAGTAPHQLPAPVAGKSERPLESFALAPGEVMLRWVARGDDGTLIERWEEPLVVPDFAKTPVVLATPRFHHTASLAEVRALQAGTANPVPAATRTFHQTERLFVETECYTADPAATPEITAHLVSSEGKELLEFQLPSPPQGKLRFEVPIRGLGKGMYLIRIRAKVANGNTEQVVAFNVTP